MQIGDTFIHFVSISDKKQVGVTATITELLLNNKAMATFKRPYKGFLGKTIINQNNVTP